MATCAATHNKTSTYDYIVKVLIIGNTRVGKSSIVLRFADAKFEPSFITTIGVDFRTKVLNIDNKSIKLYVWDTAGQERFRTITTAYYRNAMGVLLVYDITDIESFEGCQRWLKNIQTHASEDIVIVLVGNKTDFEDKRVISYEQGSSLAEKIGCSFFETSAKTGINVAEAFQALTKQCKDKLSAGVGVQANHSGRVIVNDDSGTQGKSCSGCSGGNN